MGTIRGEEGVDAWVYRVARNTVSDYYKTSRPIQELEELPPSPNPTEEEMERRLSTT